MNTIVLFNAVEEFADEVRLAHSSGIFEGTVRLTCSYRQNGTLPLVNVFLVGTFLQVLPPVLKLIKLERFCGQMFQGEKDARAQAVYEKLLEELEEELIRKIGVSVAPGICQLPEENK